MAPAFRPQCAGMDGHAVAGQGVSAMVIQQRRNKMHLNIGPIINRVPADHKSPGLGNIGTSGAFAPKQVANANGEII